MALLAAGGTGGFFQPIRILFLLLLPFCFKDLFGISHKQPDVSAPKYKYEKTFLVIWWLTALAGLILAINLSVSVKAFIHLTIYFIGFCEVIWLASKACNPQKAILTGWMLMLLITAPVAIWEFMTDHHLPQSFQQSGEVLVLGEVREARKFASVTFGNLNSYNTVLCLILCMMLIRTTDTGCTKTRFLSYICVLITSLFIIMNSSRGAFLCMAAVMALYFLILMFTGRLGKLVPIAVAALAAVFILSGKLSDTLYIIIGRFNTQGVGDGNRMILIKNGIEEIVSSFGLGIGIGNFPFIMENKYHLGITAPHNMMIEIGAQFGVVILAGFLGMLASIAKKAWRGNAQNKTAALLGLVTLIPVSIIDSTHILKASIWMYLVSLYILCNPYYNVTPQDLQKTND